MMIDRVKMTVLRDGYFNGAYPRTGETITVEAKHVEQLELAGFAVRIAPEAAPPGAVSGRTKGAKHGG
jgi:hypothetical protein